MARIQTASGPSDSQSHFSERHSRSSILEIDSWIPRKTQAISPLVDRLMMLIEGSQCSSGDEFDVALVLREALENAVVHGNQENLGKKVHIRCRCGPGNKISIVVTDQGRRFDLGKIAGNAFISAPAAEDGRSIQMMNAFRDGREPALLAPSAKHEPALTTRENPLGGKER